MYYITIALNCQHPRRKLYPIFDTKFQLKQDKIQCRAVMLQIVCAGSEQIVSQSRTTTFSSVGNISLRKPILRSSFHICSMGFISGVYVGMKKRRMFSGMRSELALCQAAPSQQRRIISSWNFFDISSKKMFMQAVLQ